MFKISSAARRAICIGGMCSLSYLAVYLARNILGSVSPQMIAQGAFSTEAIGSLSSVYFITYAVGQLLMGAIGDKIKAKYMISLGLALAGICNFLFASLAFSMAGSCIAYGMTGFSLAMIYGPMTKVVAENTEPIYATRCSLGYTFASFFGSPLAGILAALLAWRAVFAVSSGVLLAMGAVCFTVFTRFEKKGLIEYNKYRPKESGGIRELLRHQIIRYTFVAILTGVVRTTVVFWLPTYISQYLGFSAEQSALIYTAATFIISLTPFIAVFVYERLGHKMELTILLAFLCSAVFFAALYFIKAPVINIALLVLAIMSSNSAASMLWSRYCPSLRDTGRVSGATGFLDFMSYMAAAASSSLFANAVSVIGWGKLILVWFILMLIGVVVMLQRNTRPAVSASDR